MCDPSRSVCLIGKGPSAEILTDPPAWMAGWRIASVNESALVLPQSWQVDHFFAVDVESIEHSRPFWDRVRTFHIGSTLHRNLRRDPTAKLADISGLPLHRVLLWNYNDHGPAARRFAERVRGPRLAFHVTSTLALHLLAKLGYERIWCVGHDGGNREVAAPFSSYISPKDDYDRKAQAMRELARELTAVHGTDIRFYPETFE